jgi:division/cell wall cluster transcriptional repressor MraZ
MFCNETLVGFVGLYIKKILTYGIKWERVVTAGKQVNFLKKSFYVGQFHRNMDDKLRISLPVKWRSAVDDEIFLALPNPIGCITIYPSKMIARLEEKVAEVSLGDQRGQHVLAKLFSNADTFNCDQKGIIKIEARIIYHANISSDVLLVGSYMTFNLWEPSRFQNYIKCADHQNDEMSDILKGLGL